MTTRPAAGSVQGDDGGSHGFEIPGAPPPQVATTSGVARLAEVGLWYWDTGGTGPAVVLLHPFTGSALVWPYQQPVFARAGYRVIAYSRRGYERSEDGPTDRPGTGAGDLLQLMNHLGIERFHAVGSAGGAFVAGDFALSHSQRLLSLVLACSILSVQDEEMAALNRRLRVPESEGLPAYFRELSPSYRATNPGGTALWREHQRNSQPGRRVLQGYLNNRLTLPGLGRLDVSTLLIAGDADLIAPPPVARLLASHIPRSELITLPECGHSAYWEQPTRFNAAVLDFIGRHGA
jgi:pimeloyl-ACP methyl ester carboxylesterase